MKTGNTFDFDEWADLYRHDPKAFEARREALFAVELAKGTPAQADMARKALSQFNGAQDLSNPEQRLMAASQLMLASLRKLNEQMTDLSRELCTRPKDSASTNNDKPED